MLWTYLLAVVVLPLSVHTALAVKDLIHSRRCPRCGCETLPLRSRLCDGLSRLSRRFEYRKCWCARCEWEGTARLPRSAPEPRVMAPGGDELTFAGSADPGGIRCLNVDGIVWRMGVQIWPDRDEWTGRLLFVGPQQRLWVEEEWSIRGPCARDVLARGLAVPEETLVERLREIQH